MGLEDFRTGNRENGEMAIVVMAFPASGFTQAIRCISMGTDTGPGPDPSPDMALFDQGKRRFVTQDIRRLRLSPLLCAGAGNEHSHCLFWHSSTGNSASPRSSWQQRRRRGLHRSHITASIETSLLVCCPGKPAHNVDSTLALVFMLRSWRLLSRLSISCTRR